MITVKKTISASVSFCIYDAIQEYRWFNDFETQSQAIENILIAGMNALKEDHEELNLGIAMYTGRKKKYMA